MKNFIQKTPPIFGRVSIILLGSFLLIFACSKNDSVESTDNLPGHPKAKRKAVMLREGSATDHNISVEDAKTFVRAYFDHTTAGMTEEEKNGVVTSVYFPLDALEQYLETMKQADASTTGLRVYFARYNRTHINTLELTDHTLELDHLNTNTVIFVATKKDAEGYPVDIIGAGVQQPFNAGIACPPLPPSSCKGNFCQLVEATP